MEQTIISSDSHVIEVPDLWEKGMPSSFKERAPKGMEARTLSYGTALQQMGSAFAPLIAGLLFNLVLETIHAFQAFTQAFVVSGGTGGPADSTLFYTLYLYQRGFNNFDMGYASALAWLLLVIIAAFTAVNFWAAKYWVFYDD